MNEHSGPWQASFYSVVIVFPQCAPTVQGVMLEDHHDGPLGDAPRSASLRQTMHDTDLPFARTLVREFIKCDLTLEHCALAIDHLARVTDILASRSCPPRQVGERLWKA